MEKIRYKHVEEPKEYKYVGKPVDRADALEKVTGQAAYIHDLKFRDALCKGSSFTTC